VNLDIPGVLTAAELDRSARHLARLQQRNGMIPWFPGGHCDPWNLVECAMALDVAGLHGEAMAAYRWLVDTQLPSGAWHNYYAADGTIEESKLDTNVCAYLATGALHHWLSTSSRRDAEALWPAVEEALNFVLAQRRADGIALWAIEADGTRTWDYALLTGTSSIAHALQCGARLGATLGHRRPRWILAAEQMRAAIVECPEAFEPKERWAMDWYYPVLCGALDVSAGKARLADGWSTFVMDGLGVRCVSDEPWITASETAECALAFATIGDTDTAADLLQWTRAHRRPDGSYWTGIVYPDSIVFPFDEHTSYTAAVVILAADAICGTGPASGLFAPHAEY
jgi:MMP endo-(1,4)-3-O-methyl-alpha-D-mannosidase